MRIDLRLFGELTAGERTALDGLRSEIDFGTPPYLWEPAEARPWRFLVWDGERLVSHVGVLQRTVRVGGQPLHVAGVYSVMTRPCDRGRGYAGAALERAEAFMHQELPRAEHGLLMCIDERLPFYRRLGWRRVADRVVFDQPAGRHVSEINTMTLPLRGRDWPPGEVDLCGLPW